MPDSPSGMEPQLGGPRPSRPPTDQEREDAAACFQQALDYIDRMRWDDACAALRDALDLVPGFPQAAGLLALVEEVQRAAGRDEEDSRQVEALRAYARTLSDRAPSWLVSTFDEEEVGEAEPLPPAWSPEPPGYAPLPALPADEPPDLPPLSPLNPLDYLRVLGWTFLKPAQVRAYLEAGQPRTLLNVAGPVASTLLWLPLWMPALGLALGLLPSAEGPGALAWVVAAITALWALGGWLAANDSAPVALMLASAVGVMLVVLLMGTAGVMVGAALGAFFLLTAGIAAAVAGIEARAAAARLALGAAYTVVTGAVFQALAWAAPLIERFGAGSPLGDLGAPILIALAVSFSGLIAFAVAYVLPFVSTYLVAFVVEAIIEGSSEGAGTILGGLALAALGLLFLLVAWISFFGGWRLL